MRTRTLFSSGVLAVGLALLFPVALFSQRIAPSRPELRRIYGVVRLAPSNVPAQGAVVTLAGEAGEAIQQVGTDASGRFQFEQLSARIYYVSAELVGHLPAQARADLSMFPTQQVYLRLVPRVPAGSELPSSSQANVPVRSLVIPPNAHKEFERGTKLMAEREGASFQDSLGHFRKAIAMYPDYYEAYYMMGVVAMDLGQWDEAIASLKKSIEIQPEYAPAHVALGTVYNAKKEYAEAEKALRRGLELDPRSWMAHFELAKTYFGTGLMPPAEEHARQVHEMNPELPAAHLVLANVYLAKRDASGAMTEFQHFLERQPKGPVADQVRDRMKKLQAAMTEKH